MDAMVEVLASPPCRNNDDPPPPIAAIKGKRTKRYKLHSPNTPLTISPPTIAYETTTSEESTTTEEEDTARCLILLARGDHDQYPQHDQQYPRRNINNSRKRHVETTCMYACKTCGRVFASFQALGGHRASHKKPRNEKRSSTAIVLSDEEDFPSPLKRTNPSNYSVSLQFSKSNNNIIISPKIHVCSYCGAEFASGQALGGHMRRHRAGPISPSSNNAAIEEPKPEPGPEGTKKAGNSGLCLDLNQPAAADDENQRFGVIEYLHHSIG